MDAIRRTMEIITNVTDEDLRTRQATIHTKKRDSSSIYNNHTFITALLCKCNASFLNRLQIQMHTWETVLKTCLVVFVSLKICCVGRKQDFSKYGRWNIHLTSSILHRTFLVCVSTRSISWISIYRAEPNTKNPKLLIYSKTFASVTWDDTPALLPTPPSGTYVTLTKVWCGGDNVCVVVVVVVVAR